MPNLADLIEEHIRKMLEQSISDTIEIQRGELARIFQCVPSQITYVLEKRFTVERGYIVKSRRGGGGHIRVIKLPVGEDADMLQEAIEAVQESVPQDKAVHIIKRLEEEEVLTRREAAMAKSAVLRETIPIKMAARDAIRANIMRTMLSSLLLIMTDEDQGDD